jgi:glycine C-acetyltransferase
MSQLEDKLKEATAKGHKNLLIVTDGVFSMDGDIADLSRICDLAEKYQAMVLVDDSHATGFIGENGRGTAEHCKVEGRIDILVSTLGKSLGGAGGGFIATNSLIIEKLRNKARPYLFSNNILPIVAAVGIEIIDMISSSKILIKKLADNTAYFRQKIIEAGFKIHNPEGIHPIVPIMLFDEVLAAKFAKMMVEEEGIYVISFSFPVVPKKTARIRVQISSAHEKEHLDSAIAAFIRVGKKLDVI